MKWPRRCSFGAEGRHRRDSASEREVQTIEKVAAKLRANPPPMLPDDDALLHVMLLRFVREHGHGVDNIEKRFKAALHWR